jgi:hypothetical protein
MKWTCNLCPKSDNEAEYDDLEQVSGHLRVMHPDVYGNGPDRWPDGRIVVVDDTLEPAEFGTPGGRL